jgi:hypothetical protein
MLLDKKPRQVKNVFVHESAVVYKGTECLDGNICGARQMKSSALLGRTIGSQDAILRTPKLSVVGEMIWFIQDESGGKENVYLVSKASASPFRDVPRPSNLEIVMVITQHATTRYPHKLTISQVIGTKLDHPPTDTAPQRGKTPPYPARTFSPSHPASTSQSAQPAHLHPPAPKVHKSALIVSSQTIGKKKNHSAMLGKFQPIGLVSEAFPGDFQPWLEPATKRGDQLVRAEANHTLTLVFSARREKKFGLRSVGWWVG